MPLWFPIAFVCLALATILLAARRRLRLAACGLLALGLLAGYGILQNGTAEAGRLDATIAPYPNARSATWIPKVAAGNDQWVLETDDGVERVAAFYADLAARDGWELTRKANSRGLAMELTKPDRHVEILVLSRARKSRISYTVRREP